ncbi:MAG: N-formylglutamate amidohydrolase [Reyranellaceae bacterium]
MNSLASAAAQQGLLEAETAEPPFEILAPARQTAALVVASPHSGDRYPQDFVARSRLDFATLRRSEDSFVDALFGAAPSRGAPLIRALFPRAYIDPNREPFELDPAMFAGKLPDYVNSRSPRVAAGLGTIARVVANGEAIYQDKLDFADAERRVARCYRPYHEALHALVEHTRVQFGYAMLVDCHSMPSVGGPMERDPGAQRVDFVLGDCHGTSCDRRLTDLADRMLRSMGYAVARNAPYSGGFTTQHYGKPGRSVHALQIEINRACYMDEFAYKPNADFARIQRDLGELLAALAALELRA